MTPQSFGGQLRKLREQHRVTLEVIEKKTKISMSLLRSLEAGGCEDWPGGIYSRGYVRAYAEAIGVDPEHVLAAFVECYPRFAPAPVVEAAPELEVPPLTLFEEVKAIIVGWFRAATAAPGEAASAPGELDTIPYMVPAQWSMRASAASEPRERSAPAQRRARERVGESEGRSPSVD